MQESITNVIRHVGPTRVTVALKPGIDVLEIRVTDAGHEDPADDPANDPADEPADRSPPAGKPGRGILGMRERCRLLGGELDARPLPGGGFEVRARLPSAPTGSHL